MTGPDDHSNTRPISVAELLAKNGTIGAPPVGGRRRRRRGNADAVTVAELTGEIPIIRPDDPPPVEVAQQVDAPVEVEEPVTTNGVVDHVEPDTEPEAEAEPEAEEAEAESEPAEPEAEAEAEEPVAEIAEAEAVIEADAEVEGEADAEVEGEADAEVEGEVEVEGDEQAADEATEEAAEETADDTEEADEFVDTAEPDTSDDAVADVLLDSDEDDDYADAVAVAQYTAHLEQRDSDPDPVGFLAPRRFGFGRKSRADGDAEQMSPDPVEDATDLIETTDTVDRPEIEDLDAEDALDSAADGDDGGPIVGSADGGPIVGSAEDDELPSYLRSTQEPLFGGQTVADDLARRGSRPTPEDIDLGGDLDDEFDDDEEFEEPRKMSSFVHGLWIVGQSVVAVVFGAGLFVAFDQLWKWNNIVALVLSVLVILGLVVGVRVVRKTEDIGSTLIAVAVGALVTLGPLALLQSG